jgi:hypothetical protein
MQLPAARLQHWQPAAAAVLLHYCATILMSLHDQNSSGYLSGLLLSPQYPIRFLLQLGYSGSDASQLGLQVLPVSQYLQRKSSTKFHTVSNTYATTTQAQHSIQLA